jgi:DNA replication protein DnaC
VAVVQILWCYVVFDDPTDADAILDRLVHNAHRIELRGDSMRRRKPDLIGDEKDK